MISANVLPAEWPAPAGVNAFTTTRRGGVSQGSYCSFNLGDHVDDDPAAVATNRRRLREQLSLPADPVWLKQTHSARVVNAADCGSHADADASVSHRAGVVCAVLTADCLPVLLCDSAGSVVAAVHCGWRGLVAGILPATVAKMAVAPSSLLAWFGPAIGPTAFEVGAQVRAQFVARNGRHADAFRQQAAGKFMADIYALARIELAQCGVHKVYGGKHCTLNEPERFYSYRRDARCGRMLSLIWMNN